MHIFALRSLALLLGLYSIISALAIPVQYEHSLVLLEEVSPHSPRYAEVDSRSPKGSKGKTPTTLPTPKKPSNSKGPNAPKNPSKSSPRPGKSSPKAGTTTNKATASPTPTNPARPRKFKYIQPSKKAYSVCDLVNFGCLFEDDGRPPTSSKNSPKPKPGKSPKAGRVGKRASGDESATDPPTPYRGIPGAPRQYKIKLKSELIIQSKAYWTGPDLYDQAKTGLKLKEVYTSFKTNDIEAMDTYKVIALSSKPPETDKPDGPSFVTEHILELQTIKKFIESVTQTKDEFDSKLIPLSQVVNGKWFEDHWNKPYPGIADRPDAVAAYDRPTDPKDETINDIVFEALGSKTNAEQFVLCEASINSAKAKLWSNQNPWDPEKLKRLTKRAAAGGIDSADPFSVFRTVMAVYSYMKLPEVKNRLQNEINHVGEELSKKNLAHIVGQKELPQDEEGEVVDLQKLWVEYMAKHIARFERKGVEWMNYQLKNALILYNAELSKLEIAESNMEKARTRAAKETLRKEYEKLLPTAEELKKDETKKDAEYQRIKKEFLALKEKVDALDMEKRDEERKKVGFWVKSAEKRAAAMRREDSRMALWAIQRQLVGLDDVELPKHIAKVRKDVSLLETFKKVVDKWEVDNLDKQFGGMHLIDISEDPQTPTSPT